MIDSTHEIGLRSWVMSANAAETDFPIQNLPFGRFRKQGSTGAFQIGIAIGDQILPLRQAGIIDHDDMHLLMALAPEQRRALRQALSEGLREGSARQDRWAGLLLNQSVCEMTLPCDVRDYTDFYTGLQHATAVGKLFRPDNPLLPNYKWVPIGYHGRASSLRVSGASVVRPAGQTAPSPQATDGAHADAPSTPAFGPCRRLDYELELGYYIGTGNPLGTPVPIDEAESHLFGVSLLNDWSARDIQAWEYQPLGPFLSKSFLSSLSPWLVTMEALAPFRRPFERAAAEPQPLPYLDGHRNRASGAVDIHLAVLLQTPAMRAAGQAPVALSQGNAADAMYWTPAQLVAHHTVNGCNLQAGDLFGTGTLSGNAPSEAGSLLELTQGGKQPFRLPNGEQRTFLEDGDTVIFRGWCQREGAVRIGLGEVRGTIAANDVRRAL